MNIWLWNGTDPSASEADLKAKYRKIRDHGLKGVFLSGGIDEREFAIVRESGLELHTWMWTTNRGDTWIRENHPEWFMVSRTGKSCFDQPPYVDYYRWVSPVIPGVQSYLRDRVAELAAHPAVNGVHLDYVRYPDVILPRDLWRLYDVDQTEELPDYDFCYSEATRQAFMAETGRDILTLEDPAHDQEWLHFRYDSVTKLVKQLTEVAHGYGKQITAAVFPTPSLARKICRQDWDKWPLDAFCPMIYQSFYQEPIEWIGDCVRENLHAVRQPIIAGLFMPALAEAGTLTLAINLARQQGAKGVSFFDYRSITDAQWSELAELNNGSS